MTKYDPAPGQPYGKCSTCGIDIETEADSNAHMSETRPAGGGSSHRIRVLNPSRERRILSAVAWPIEEATGDACTEFDRWVERGDVTVDEIKAALSGFPDFAEAWDDYVAEAY